MKANANNSPLMWFRASREAEALLEEVVEALPPATQLAFPTFEVEEKLRTRRGPDLYQPGLFQERKRWNRQVSIHVAPQNRELVESSREWLRTRRERRAKQPCILCHTVSDAPLNRFGECEYCTDDAEGMRDDL